MNYMKTEKYKKIKKYGLQLTGLQWLRPKKNDLILDIGCNTGRNTSYLNTVCLALGIDINKKALSKRISKNLICADALYLPFKKNVFDKIIIFEVLEHVKDDDKALENIAKTLKINGKLVLSTPNKQLFDFWDPAYVKWKLLDPNHIHRHYSKQDLTEKLKKYGFEVKKCRVLGSYLWLINRWLNVLLKYGLKKNLFLTRLINRLNELLYKKYEKGKEGRFDIFILAELKKKDYNNI